MQELKYRLIYTGGEADENRLPAHGGSQSLEGITWAYSLLGHYLAKGKIQTRGSLDPRIKFYISPPKPGSFETEIIGFITNPENLFATSIIGIYSINTTTNLINSFILHCFKKVSGIISEIDDDGLDEFLKKIPPGDLEANIASIEPSMKRAHSVIGKGAKELDIYQNRSHLANFDIETKNYLNTNIVKEGFIEKQVSVGSFNANSGNGSIYDPILARTVPFSLAKFPKEGTRESLSYSLDRYTNGVGSLIDVTCQEIVAHDGRIKRLIIHAASPVLFAE